MNKNILVYINNFHPDRGGGASVFTDMCVELNTLGYDVTVRCAYPYYPEWKDKSGKNGFRIESSQYKGVNIQRHGLYIPNDPTKFKNRMFHELSYLFSLLRSVVEFKRYDVTIAYCPSFASVIVGSLVKLLTRSKMWLNVQDIPGDAASNVGLNSSGSVKYVLDKVQSFFFNRADVWSTISPVMEERLEEIIKPEIPHTLVCNWLNLSMQDSIEETYQKLDRQGEQHLKLLYAGNIGAKQGILQLCKILHDAPGRFEFNIFGDGSEAQNVSGWVSEVNDSRFKFSGFLPEADFVKQLKEADMFVITEKDGAGSSFIPSKLIPSISAGTPILALCDSTGPLGTEVRGHSLGPQFEWSEIDQLVKLVSLSQIQSTSIQTWSNNCLARAQIYGRTENIKRINRLLTVLCDKKLSKKQLFLKIAQLDNTEMNT